MTMASLFLSLRVEKKWEKQGIRKNLQSEILGSGSRTRGVANVIFGMLAFLGILFTVAYLTFSSV